MSKKRRKKPVHKSRPQNAPVKKTIPTTAALEQKAAPKKQGGKYKTAALALIMVTAVALAAWFALSPTLTKNRMLEHQADLLDSIEQGGGEIVLDEAFAAAEVDYYDDNGETPALDAPAMTESEQATQSEGYAPAETLAQTDTVITGIGVLTIDKIGAKLPVTDGVSTAQLKIAVGHVPETAPIGGEGSAVIAGHRSYTYGHFFNRLDELAVGDVIQYQSISCELMEFAVYEILEVLPGDPAALEQPEGRQTITLLTCTPIRTATHRLLVRAERIS